MRKTRQISRFQFVVRFLFGVGVALFGVHELDKGFVLVDHQSLSFFNWHWGLATLMITGGLVTIAYAVIYLGWSVYYRHYQPTSFGRWVDAQFTEAAETA